MEAGDNQSSKPQRKRQVRHKEAARGRSGVLSRCAFESNDVQGSGPAGNYTADEEGTHLLDGIKGFSAGGLNRSLSALNSGWRSIATVAIKTEAERRTHCSQAGRISAALAAD